MALGKMNWNMIHLMSLMPNKPLIIKKTNNNNG